jgi:hypothetical protein
MVVTTHGLIRRTHHQLPCPPCASCSGKLLHTAAHVWRVLRSRHPQQLCCDMLQRGPRNQPRRFCVGILPEGAEAAARLHDAILVVHLYHPCTGGRPESRRGGELQPPRPLAVYRRKRPTRHTCAAYGCSSLLTEQPAQLWQLLGQQLRADDATHSVDAAPAPRRPSGCPIQRCSLLTTLTENSSMTTLFLVLGVTAVTYQRHHTGQPPQGQRMPPCMQTNAACARVQMFPVTQRTSPPTTTRSWRWLLAKLCFQWRLGGGKPAAHTRRCRSQGGFLNVF